MAVLIELIEKSAMAINSVFSIATFDFRRVKQMDGDGVGLVNLGCEIHLSM